MLIDDLWNLGIGHLIDTELPYHVVKLPFPVAPYAERNMEDIRDERFSLLSRQSDYLEKKLVPVDKHGMCDGTFAKPPYRQLILFGPGDTGCLILLSEGKEQDGRLHMAAISVFRDTINAVCPSDHPFLLIPYSYARYEDGSFRGYSTDIKELVMSHEYHNLLEHAYRDLFPSPKHDKCLQKLLENIKTDRWAEWFTSVIQSQPIHIVTALSLMNAKNIEMEHVPVSPKLKTARIRRGKHPGVEYHVLKLRPFASLHRSANHQHGIDSMMPIHWVRGHFKIFNDKKPLFGKYTGRFWWQPHIAGSDRQRIIEKSYELDVSGL